MSKYGVLLIGGRRTHQETHGAAFAANPLCHVVGVTEERDIPEYRTEMARQLAQIHGVPFIPDLDAALARDDVHVVSMCADVERRGRVAVRCAEAGKHIYLDKPVAGNVNDADAIVAAIEKAGVRAQMQNVHIHTGWANAAREAIRSGRIGDLKALHVEFIFSKGRAGTVPEGTVRQEREEVGQYTFVEAKREMFDVGVYGVGLVWWLTGRKFESVLGHTGNYVFQEHVGRGVEDFGVMSVGLEGGINATVIGGRFGWMSHPKGGPQRIVVIGTNGVFTFDGWRPRIEVYNDEDDFRMPPVHPMDPMGMWGSTADETNVMPKRRWIGTAEASSTALGDEDSFIDCIERGVEPEMNARASAPQIDVIQGAYISAARGERVRLPLPRG